MSDQRAPASPAISAPGVSATLIASCRAEPFAYASMTLDCQLAAAFERRPLARAIHTIKPIRITAPSRTQSHRRLELDSLAAGELLG